ncbi:MAG TPA: hypothetical protein VKU38_09850 [Ktedonobacteraceae bacterium]|nr:hypothetical protein [Ktedonobacteraceae bacterium]
MAFRATCVAPDPLDYFLRQTDAIRVADIVLRENKDPKEIFSLAIRLGTGSKWSHSAIFYLLSDPSRGFHNTFLIEAKTKGINMVSWRNEIVPYDNFTVGIKRPRLDWYSETPFEVSRHSSFDAEDCHGIGYLRHVRGIALDQINGLFDHKTVYELAALYAERVAERHLSAIPQIAGAADSIATLLKKWDEKSDSVRETLRFICSGLLQYSYFEALRIRIANDLAIPTHREAALNNLNNMQQIIFRPDPKNIIPMYMRQVQNGELDIAHPAPGDVLDLLKTATPADFNNSDRLEWRYVICKGVVWKIDEAPIGYQAQSQDETEIIKMLGEEHPRTD